MSDEKIQREKLFENIPNKQFPIIIIDIQNDDEKTIIQDQF